MKILFSILLIAVFNIHSVLNYDDEDEGGFHSRATKGDTWAHDKKTQGRAAGYSHGLGASSTYSGPNTTNASSVGTHGSGSRTAFKNKENSMRNNWANYADSDGNAKQVSNNWVSKEAQDNTAQGKSVGWGMTAAKSNKKDSGASAWGSRGADAESDYNNNFHHAKDNWSRVRVGDDWKNTKDSWSDKGRTSTHGKAQGLGGGDAATNSNYHGSTHHAIGLHGSRGAASHKNQNASVRNQREWGMVGDNKFSRGNDWAQEGNSHGGTSSQAYGTGIVSGFTDKDKGSGANAVGSRGTKTDSMWGGQSWKGGDAWSDKETWD